MSGFGHLVILDAGSSGTRLYGFRWPVEEDLKKVAKITTFWEGPKVDGALETNYCEVPLQTETKLQDYFNKIFPLALRSPEDLTAGKKSLLTEFGMKTIGEFKAAKVPIFVLGTAGMRVFKKWGGNELAETRHTTFKAAVEKHINRLGDNGRARDGGTDEPIVFGARATYNTISGEHEAAYGWVAANSVLGAFDSGFRISPLDTVGYLEMGGQSAQLAFRPLEYLVLPKELYDIPITMIKLREQVFSLCLKSWDLGAIQAWKKYEQEIANNGDRDNGVVLDAYSPHGREWTGQDGETQFKGCKPRGDSPQAFRDTVRKIFDETPLDNGSSMENGRLLDKHLLDALKTRHFVGGANFWYSTRSVFGRNLDKDGTCKTTAFSFKKYQEEVEKTKKLDWLALQLRMRNDPEYVGRAWFVAEWVQIILQRGLDFNFTGDEHQRETDLSFRPFGGIGKEELTWTLGAAVLYANGNNLHELDITTGKAAANRSQQEWHRSILITEANRQEEQLYDHVIETADLLAARRRGEVARSIEAATRAHAAAADTRRAAENNAKASRDHRRDAGEDVAVDDEPLVKNAMVDLANKALDALLEENVLRRTMPSGLSGEEKKEYLAAAGVKSSRENLLLAVKKAAGSLPATATVADL
ncbi:hypothetical protein HWV62_13864 [Athelia sp. TMB]|nr:hypothetical protein HWV62_15631 [Athelia sp. TMB]KAF7973981.1 hypothetical protein HWV62_13864 [Athelia sp. TMB]